MRSPGQPPTILPNGARDGRDMRWEAHRTRRRRQLVEAALKAIRKHGAAYLMAVGGAAYLVSKAIKQARVLGFADLGMEAIYEFEVQDMPVTVAVDAQGNNVHTLAPAEWKRRIAEEHLLEGA